MQAFQQEQASVPQPQISASGRQISVKSNLGGRNFRGAASVQDSPQIHRLPGPYPIGTEIGATVRRGSGWDHIQYKDQDGKDQDGGAGKLGEITYVGKGEDAGLVIVMWDGADDKNGQPTDNYYRMGRCRLPLDPSDKTKGEPVYDLEIVTGKGSQAERRAEAQRQQQQQQNRSSVITSAFSQSRFQRHGNPSSRPGNASSSQQQPQPQQQAGYDPNHSSFQFDSFRF